MKRFISVFTCTAMLLASCNVEKLQTPDVEVDGKIYTASMEGKQTTKTHYDNKNVMWDKGDLITIFECSTSPKLYKLSSGEGTTNASFKPYGFGGGTENGTSSEIGHNIAVYPDEVSTCEFVADGQYKIKGLSIPHVQKYVKNSFAKGSWPMVSAIEETDTDFAFKNVCGGVKVNLTGTQKVKAVIFKGNNGEILAGTADVDVFVDDATNKPIATIAAEGGYTSVTLDCKANGGVQLDPTTPTAFIFALAPQVLSKGFTVSVVDENEITSELIKSDESVEVKRNYIGFLDAVMPEVKSASTNTEATSELNITTPNPKVELSVTSDVTVINLGSGFTSDATTNSVLNIVYDSVPQEIIINQDGYNSTSVVAPGESKGKIVIDLPDGSTVLSAIITTPNMTVEINGGTIAYLDALTATNTLIVTDNAIIDELNVRGGNVYVCAGSQVKKITKEGKTAEELAIDDKNKKPIYVFAEAGAVIPTFPKGDYDHTIAIVPVTDAEQWNIIGALANADSYILQANSTISSTIVVDKTFTLDLNGYTITNDSDLYNVYNSQRFMVVVCRGGHLTIEDSKGSGKIATKDEETSGNTSANLAVALTHYGEEMWASETPASLTVKGGHLYGTGYGISGNGTRYNTNITIEGGVIESKNLAIYHPQDGNFTMTGGTLRGKAGIEIRGGGDHTISGGTIEATAPWNFEQASGKPTSEGGAVVVNLYDQDRRNLNLNITGGTFIGAQAIHSLQPTFNTYKNKVTVNLRGGTFKGGITGRHAMNDKEAFDVYGGTFNNFDFHNKMSDNADVKVILNSNTEVFYPSVDKNQKVSIDLKGHVLTFGTASHTPTISGNAELKIFDSTISGIPTTNNLIVPSTKNNGIYVEKNGKITLNNIKSVRDVFAFLRANEGTVNIDNCDLTDKYYITNTNASHTGGVLEFGSGAVYNITNSILTTTETPIMMNVPMTMNISNTTLNGKWQCAMVRGGTMNMKGCTLNYTRDGAFAEKTNWGSGNIVPMAAITGGNKGTGAYQYPTSITIDDATVINMLGANNTDPKIYLYSDGANMVSYTGKLDKSVMIGTGSKEVTINGTAYTPVAIDAIPSFTFDANKNYYIGSGVLAVEADNPIILGKSIAFAGTEFQTKTNVSINAETVVMKGIKVSGTEKNSNNSTIHIEGAKVVDIDGADFNMTGSKCYNGFEINLLTAAKLEKADIKNVNFNTKLSNNAISIYRTTDNAVINIENCKFVDVSNCLRLSNADNKSGIKVTVKDCVCNSWETSPKYAGFLMFEDYTSVDAYVDAYVENLFGKDKIAVTFDNLKGPGNKVYTGKSQDVLTGSVDQIYYVYYDGIGVIPFGDGSKHPTIVVK